MTDSKWTEPKINKKRVMVKVSKETGNAVTCDIWRHKWTSVPVVKEEKKADPEKRG